MKKFVKPIARLVNIDSTVLLARSEIGVSNDLTTEMLSKSGFFYDLGE